MLVNITIIVPADPRIIISNRFTLPKISAQRMAQISSCLSILACNSALVIFLVILLRSTSLLPGAFELSSCSTPGSWSFPTSLELLYSSNLWELSVDLNHKGVALFLLANVKLCIPPIINLLNHSCYISSHSF